MKYRRMKAAAVAALFLIAGVLYSANRNQDVFLYEQESGYEENRGDEALADETQLRKAEVSEAKASSDAGALPEAQKASNASAGEKNPSSELLRVHVHVCGAVKKAGVYLLSADSIVADAIETAGGVVKGGAADYLNLAEAVSEGDKIYVPFLKELEKTDGKTGEISFAAGDPAQMEESSALVNINTAMQEQLMTLSGIGKTRAEAIIAYRESNGEFQKPEDIMKVSGIKEGAFKKIKDQITV
ncbi:MAG: helix-hairpin-helix domain-containing protein [Lachnospiraceae bacterium]|nr:helix-hairpin-helix domain-containing protein [Lachnospiraceae bacterium]